MLFFYDIRIPFSEKSHSQGAMVMIQASKKRLMHNDRWFEVAKRVWSISIVISIFEKASKAEQRSWCWVFKKRVRYNDRNFFKSLKSVWGTVVVVLDFPKLSRVQRLFISYIYILKTKILNFLCGIYRDKHFSSLWIIYLNSEDNYSLFAYNKMDKYLPSIHSRYSEMDVFHLLIPYFNETNKYFVFIYTRWIKIDIFYLSTPFI